MNVELDHRPLDRAGEETVVLKPSVIVEPLVDRWYAWPHLLAPTQQALNLAYRYLPSVESFVSAPQVHAAAAADPTTYGGPFLELGEDAVGAAREYLYETRERRSEALAFARDIRELNAILQLSDGFSLDELKEKAPASLRGRIELVYDLNSHAKIRVLEEMFAFNDLGHKAAQALHVYEGEDVDRPFFLSTPRLASPGGLIVDKPFDSLAAKALCSARRRPARLDKLAGLLDQPVEKLEPFFTSAEDLKLGSPYSGSGVRVRYFGHACLLIETAAVSILVDPTFANAPVGAAAAHFTFSDLPPRIDYLFLSHGHQDHFCPEFLMQLRDSIGEVLIPPSNTGEISDPSLKRMLASLGYENITILEPLEKLPIPGGSLLALPFSGEHCDLDVHSKQCLRIELNSRRICLFVDSDAIDVDVYRRLSHLLHEPDLLFIGMECFGAPLSWLYGPLATKSLSKRNDNSRRMSGANCARASQLIESLKPARVFVYAMGQEPWMQHLMGLNYTEASIQITESQRLIATCRANGIVADSLSMMMELEL